MGILEFISEIVSSVAWPVAAIVIVTSLRSELGDLLKRITKLKHGDSEVDFEKLVRDASSDAEAEGTLPPSQPTPNQERLQLLAEQSPRGAILDSWLQVESALKNYATRHGVGLDYAKSPSQLIGSIEMYSMEIGGLGKGIFQMLHKLRNLRNEAVHVAEKEITSDVALEYIALAERVRNRIEEA